MDKKQAEELLQSFRVFANQQWGEHISDYMIKDFIRTKFNKTNCN